MSEIELSAVEAEPITAYDTEETYDVVVIGARSLGPTGRLSRSRSGRERLRASKEPKAASQGASCCYINRESTDDLAIAHLLRHMSDNGDSRGSWDLNRAWPKTALMPSTGSWGTSPKQGIRKTRITSTFPSPSSTTQKGQPT